MITEAIDKYIKVFAPNRRCSYKKYSFPQRTSSSHLLENYRSMSGDARASYYELCDQLCFNDWIDYNIFYMYMVVDVKLLNLSENKHKYVLRELLAIDFLVKLSRGNYYINFAYAHCFTDKQLLGIKSMVALRKQRLDVSYIQGYDSCIT
jgi:hypothetical protein